MKIQDNPPIHLTYCLNVHPGETWQENLAAIRDKTLSIRDRVASPEMPFGIGLRLSHEAARTLAQPGTLAEFKQFLKDQSLYVFTINGFPHGQFHGTVVKENVYRPDWRSPKRRDYTILLADILAELLPEGTDGSISTVPGSYKSWIGSTEDVKQMVRMLMDCVAHLAHIREHLEKDIHVGLEPEPDCFLENTDETIDFFDSLPKNYGYPYLAHKLGCGLEEAEGHIRKHLGVCIDTCHMAVQFEDACTSLRRLREHGIRISKIQISAAVRTRPTEEALRGLNVLCEPVYLHQVKARRLDGNIESYPDLAAVLSNPIQAFPIHDEWRIHFHVPIYWSSCEALCSTSNTLTPAFWKLLTGGVTSHVEIETYTFKVLPQVLRNIDMTQSIAKEYAWVRECLFATF